MALPMKSCYGLFREDKGSRRLSRRRRRSLCRMASRGAQIGEFLRAELSGIGTPAGLKLTTAARSGVVNTGTCGSSFNLGVRGTTVRVYGVCKRGKVNNHL